MYTIYCRRPRRVTIEDNIRVFDGNIFSFHIAYILICMYAYAYAMEYDVEVHHQECIVDLQIKLYQNLVTFFEELHKTHFFLRFRVFH